VVKATLRVLRANGGPLKLTTIFNYANELGLLADSAHNTIRGRMSQHLQHCDDPVVIRLPKRRGWMRSVGKLKNVKVTPEWVDCASAPSPLQTLIAEEGTLSLLRVMGERLDPESVQWLLETLPFEPRLRRRLERAVTSAKRKEILRGA
jgi:hypothetical protein